MAKTGRKPKAGRRTKSGRLARNNYPIPAYDRGSEWVRRQRERFGEHYSTAIGRAFATGLLGEGAEAKARLDAAKRFVRAYRKFIGGEFYRCPLDDTPRGNIVTLDSEKDAEQQAWLFIAMDSMDQSGGRPYLDQLLSREHTDTGPQWLDRLLDGKRDNRDRIVLEAALKALDAITPEVHVGILWERY